MEFLKRCQFFFQVEMLSLENSLLRKSRGELMMELNGELLSLFLGPTHYIGVSSYLFCFWVEC